MQTSPDNHFIGATPTSLEAAKQVHFIEMRSYRKRRPFILGMVMMAAPLLVAVVSIESWSIKIGALLVALGFKLVHDTITQHFASKLAIDRFRKNNA